MDSIEFKKWIIDNNIWQKTFEGFWVCFENYKKEDPEEFTEYFGDFDRAFLILKKEQIALKIKNDPPSIEHEEYVEAYIDLEYKEDDIGYYSMLFNFSGESFDDYFVLE